MTDVNTDKAPNPLAELGLGAAWLLGLAASLQILDRLLPAASLAAAVLGALLADMAASRAGVRWNVTDDPDAPPIAFPAAARRVAVGAGIALAAGLAVIGIARFSGLLHGHGEGPSLSSAVLFAILRAAAVATRDELLFRGIPLVAAARANIPAPFARAFAALTSGAAIAFLPGTSPAAIALAVASGWLYAGLWQRERGAFMAVGAHAAWMLLFGSLLHGGLFDVDWTNGSLAIGATSWGAPAWLAAGSFVVAALVLPWIPRTAEQGK